MASNRYCVDVAKRGTAGCKECKKKIDKGLLRIAKILPNPFTDSGGEMKEWYHARCIFQKLTRARATTKKIESPDDIEGWDEIDDEQQAEVLKYMSEFSVSSKGSSTTPKKKGTTSASSDKKSPAGPSASPKRGSSSSTGSKASSAHDTFREFRRLCASIAEEPGYKNKTAIVSEFFEKGPDKKGFDGDLYLWVKLLLPTVDKTVYNLQNKQLVKLFSQIFDTDQEEMLEDLENGDVAETVRIFFEESEKCPPCKKSTLTLQEVDNFLKDLSQVSKEDEQINMLRKVAKRSTANDLKMFVRFIKHDIRINAGPKHILTALHPTAYDAFQASQNLKDVVKRARDHTTGASPSKTMHVKASLMTPVKPMLAEACRSMAQAFKKCPNGLLVEIKYDGERVQIHKSGQEFSYFSRSLKPVMPHKVLHLKEFIPKAFPYGNDLILDSEILLVDKTGKPLPFGTLGAHKQAAFKDATVCLFVFDCLQFNDINLMNKPLVERRKFMQENMKPIKNHVMFSEQTSVKEPAELNRMIKSVVSQGLEGLLIKDKLSVYEPGKRHWLKMKKDYIEEGTMADSADLVVVGAYYGTGKKGGIMSVFLMGCFNNRSKKWCTVTKVGGGHDDETLEKLQTSLKMTKISKDASKVPAWLNVTKSLVPDFVAVDPNKAQVWEITGAEFTKSEVHTANGISIRFPRVTRIRHDKTAKDATSLSELQKLYEKSKETTDMVGLGSSGGKRNSDSNSPSRKKKRSGSEDSKPGSKSRSRSQSRSKSPARSASRSPKRKSRSRSRSKSPPKKKTGSKNRSRSRSKSKSPARKKSKPARSRSKSPSRKVLPNIFTGIKLLLPSSLDKVDSLKRYFVAYDGTLLEEHQEKEASHVVTVEPLKDKSRAPKAIQVSPDWLWDCVKLQKLIPEHLYRPTDVS